MRKIGKVVALLLVALWLMSGLTVSVAAENALVLGQDKNVPLSSNTPVELIFTAPVAGTYYFHCSADAPFKANNQAATKENGFFVVSYPYMMEEGFLYTLSLESSEPVTVTVQVVKTNGTTVPTASDPSATGSETTPTASESTHPSATQSVTLTPSVTTGSTTEGTTTTTVSTTTTTVTTTRSHSSTTIPSATPSTQTIPQTTTSVSRFPYPTRSAATSIASPIGGIRPSGGFADLADRSDRDTRGDRDDDSVEVGKVVLYSILALAIMVGGGVAIYFISRPNNPKQH